MSSESPPDALPSAANPFKDYPIDERSCRLLGPTALVVQGLMGVLAILSLVYKRHREKPKRPWRIWLFDVSKQVVGQMFVHGVNVLISDVTAHHSAGVKNACVFYFLNVLIDTTLGVALIYLILHALTYVLTKQLNCKGFESGQYGSPPSIGYWARQAAVYVLSLSSMKLLVVALFVLVPGIFKFGEWLLSWTEVVDSDALQVIFTMGIFPIIMNILQFWLIDSIVKASASSVALPYDSPRHLDDDQDQEPLFTSNSDDEDDNPRTQDIENQRGATSHPSTHPHDEHKTAVSIRGEQKVPDSTSSTPGQSGSAMHAYPPSMSGSGPSSSNPPPKSLPNSTRKYKRSPPPPLPITSVNQPAVNSPLPQLQPQPTYHQHHTLPPAEKDDWAETWEDSDDWANKVGEEDGMGRRIEEKGGLGVLDSWESGMPAVVVG